MTCDPLSLALHTFLQSHRSTHRSDDFPTNDALLHVLTSRVPDSVQLRRASTLAQAKPRSTNDEDTDGLGGGGGTRSNASSTLVSPTRNNNQLNNESDSDTSALFQAVSAPVDHIAMYRNSSRRKDYVDQALRLSRVSGVHELYHLMTWCHQQDIFLHPLVRLEREPTAFRDYRMIVTQRVAKHTPLLAIPLSSAIGFRGVELEKGGVRRNDEVASQNTLHDAEREKNFTEASGTSDYDVCQFFFSCLGMVVGDLVTALNSPQTDDRHAFAKSIHLSVRTLLNAPYFSSDVHFGDQDTCLADVLLQMIHNYLNGGPLVGKVDRPELQWAISVCLSHATPLTIGSQRSLGILPLVHMLPHGGLDTNSVVIARPSRRQASERIDAYFTQRFGCSFKKPQKQQRLVVVDEHTGLTKEGKSKSGGGGGTDGGGDEDDDEWVYVVPLRDLEAGESILTQAMAPVCDKETEAAHMWRLSCGVVPDRSMPTSQLQKLQDDTLKEIIAKGGEILKKRGAIS